MDSLRRELAPISDTAWKEIEDEAKNALNLNLSGRRIVDVTEPQGHDLAAVNLGRLEVPDSQVGDVHYGIRKVLPLVEVRAPFSLDIWELDNIERGAEDADLDDLRRAAKEIAKFEETAVYEGFPDGEIHGLTGSSGFEPVTAEATPSALVEAVTRAVLRMKYADVDGPYALALGAALYQTIDDAGTEHGYPVRKRLTSQIEGPIVHAPYLEGGVVMSTRGGDAELTIGRDISIGYHSHDERTVGLYFTESFTFRVIGPEAVVRLAVESV
ncbi:MAG: family 1 encapsulin nanocompartment shell protein [Candidatus Sulfomarinibacteraceae bacterium]